MKLRLSGLLAVFLCGIGGLMIFRSIFPDASGGSPASLSTVMPKTLTLKDPGLAETVEIYEGRVWFLMPLSVGTDAAAVRDTMRRMALAEYFDLTVIPVCSQWGSFVPFAVLLVLGLGIVTYMPKLAFAPKSRSN